MANTTVERLFVSFFLRVQLISFRSFIGFFILIFGYTSIACAADWKLIPTLGLHETYSDNVRLAANGLEKSAYITQFSPGLTLTAFGPSIKLDVNFLLRDAYYAGQTSENKLSHSLNANANMTLIQNLFFLDGKASIGQKNQSPFGSVTEENNVNLSNNSIDVRTQSVSPYFRRNFGNVVTGELRYTNDSVTTNSLSSFNSTSDALGLSLNSGSAYKSVNLGLNSNFRNIQFAKHTPLETELTTLNFGYHTSPVFKLTATAGYEKNSYVSLGRKPPGFIGNVGIVWSPSERTHLNINTGERFYGRTHELSFDYRSRLSKFSLGYNEDVATTRGQFLIPATNDTSEFLNQLWQTSIPDAVVRQQTVDSFIRDSGIPSALAEPINAFTNRVFLQKKLHGSLALTGQNNTIIFNLFNTSRDPLSTIGVDGILDPSSLSKLRQKGVNVLWNFRFSPRTNANLSGTYTRADTLDTGLIANTKALRASISRQFKQKLKGTLEIRRLQRDSTNVNGNYEENAVTLYLLLGF